MGNEEDAFEEPKPLLRRTSRKGSFRKFIVSLTSPPPETEFIYHEEQEEDEELQELQLPPPPMQRVSRMGSIRKAMTISFQNSLRRTRKIFGIGVAPVTEYLPKSEQDVHIQRFNRNESVRLSRCSTKHYEVIKTHSEDKIFTSVRPIPPSSTCLLTKFFPRIEKPPNQKKTLLSSFERKRRYHQTFGADHHAKEQLFCPLQASQVEFAFKTQVKSDIVIKVQAPNGESSGYIYPNNIAYTSFTPSNIGCGHGKWLVHVAIRKGCKFHHGYTRQFNLIGQGVLFFQVDMAGTLRDDGKLWLDCLN
ncbi:RHDF1 [Caenorhabditis elegans]|uniref:RHDF1 n=1 Tax=Caenorhabditis elegans TaxID=6239 RepID=Q93802_CAEEL|nr:RHDF1 [Caenorhabditis elegans]CAB02668.2 RHDF1 [Caenorhabditis elegans]|eukprot:NP_509841.2 Uncharacterized protein CELE_F58A3.3 [Caenorhabditis elegans]